MLVSSCEFTLSDWLNAPVTVRFVPYLRLEQNTLKRQNLTQMLPVYVTRGPVLRSRNKGRKSHVSGV